MSWEQHRYAVERARDYRRKLANEQNEAAGGCNLQGEANGSDAEMLDEVADFLRGLEGSKAGDDKGQRFIDDWNRMISTVSVLCEEYNLPKPAMVFHPKWNSVMRSISMSPISDTIIYAGVHIRFGIFEMVSALRMI